MNEALSGNAAYFKNFYADIQSQRFSLIISEPLHRSEKDSEFEFGEENNAWVKWVSAPVRCYYKPIYTFKDARTQLLAPTAKIEDCSSVIPPTP